MILGLVFWALRSQSGSLSASQSGSCLIYTDGEIIDDYCVFSGVMQDLVSNVRNLR